MSNHHERSGILRRIGRFFLGREEPSPELSSPTLFTATRLPRSSVTPEPEPEPLFDAAPAATRERDLWDDDPLVLPSEAEPRAVPEADEPSAGPADADEPLFAPRDADASVPESPAPPVPDDTDEDVSVEALTHELSRLAQDDPYDAGADASPHLREAENLFSSPRRRERRIEVSPPVPEHVTGGDGGPRVSVHGERLDSRPGPIRMTPSEALALAKDGREALQRRRPSS